MNIRKSQMQLTVISIKRWAKDWDKSLIKNAIECFLLALLPLTVWLFFFFFKRMKRSWATFCIRNAALIKYNLQFAGGYNFPTKGRDSKRQFCWPEGGDRRRAAQDVNKEGAWRLRAMKMFRPKQQKSMFRGNNGRCTNVILWPSRPTTATSAEFFRSKLS